MKDKNYNGPQDDNIRIVYTIPISVGSIVGLKPKNMNTEQNSQNSTEGRNDGNTVITAVFLGFFTILWIVALILCITFAVKVLIIEMWIANAFMWIGLFGMIWSKNCC